MIKLNKITLIIVLIILISLSWQLTVQAEYNLILNFDDGYRGVYTNAFTIMKKYEIPGVVFIPTAFVNQDKHINLSQLHDLIDHSWEIGSHTVHHPNLLQLTPPGIEKEILKSKNFLYDNKLITKNYASFCSPMSKWNDTISDIVSKNYQIARSNKLMNLKINQEIDANIKVVLKTTTLVSLKNWIIKSSKENIPLILVFHDISKEADHLYNFSPHKFSKLIRYIDNKNINVITFKELLTRY